jgi:hypothetical protein
MDDATIREMPSHLVDGEEEWVRETDEQDLRGVNALRMTGEQRWPWQVGVWAASFVREEPLEGDLRAGVDAALRAVPGVTDVVEQDREVWRVAGTPSGRDLVEAVGAVVDELVARTRALYHRPLDS